MWKNCPDLIRREKTLEKTKKNLIEAITLVLEANKQIMEEELKGKEFTTEEIGEVVV